MTALRLRTTTVLLALAATAAGCASTTNGQGSIGTASPGTGSSSRDFPSGSASGGSTAATATASSPTGASSGPSTHPVPSAPLHTATVHGASGRTYLVKIWAEVDDHTCFDHAYGQPIITFLTQHPCNGLHRILATTTIDGRGVGFAESATGFHGPAADPYKYAGEFTKLELQNGTGSIDDLLRDGYRLPSGPTAVPSSEAFNVLGQDEGVTIWDAWYLDGPTPDNDKTLITMTQDLFLQF